MVYLRGQMVSPLQPRGGPYVNMASVVNCHVYCTRSVGSVRVTVLNVCVRYVLMVVCVREFVRSCVPLARSVFDFVSFRFASQVSLVFITSDLLASGTVNMATVLVFVLTSCYYVVLARRRMHITDEEGEVLKMTVLLLTTASSTAPPTSCPSHCTEGYIVLKIVRTFLSKVY